MAPCSRRSTLLALLFVVALLVAPTSALAAGDNAARAQERYYQSYSAAPDTSAALAQEQYLASYGQPTPIPHPASGGSSDTPWLIAGLSVAAIVLVAGGATQLRRRRTAGSPA